MNLKLLSLISVFIMLSPLYAQFDSLTVNTSCGLSNASGTYKYLDMYNGKPRFETDSVDCSILRTQTDCDAILNNGTFQIRWDGSKWEWISYKKGKCIWLVQVCVPDLINKNQDSVLIATNAANTSIPPQIGWVVDSSIYCVPEITTGDTCNIINQAVNQDTTLCSNGMHLIKIDSSQRQVVYYLRDDNNDSIIDGPINGNDSIITLSTAIVSSTTSFNIFAHSTIDSASCNIQMSNKVTVTVKSSSLSINTITACDSYTWSQNGMTYTISGMYNDTVSNAAGCDSIITLDLTVNQSTSSTMTATSCDSYTWSQNGMTYTISGMYNDTVSNAAACDSIITLDLTIDTVGVTVTQNNFDLIAIAKGTRGTMYDYQWLDCNNRDTAIAGATSDTFNVTTNGSYAVEVRQNGCVDTSSCISILNVGIAEIKSLEKTFTIYPNPTNNRVTIVIRKRTEFEKINIVDIRGTLIKSILVNSNQISIDVSDYAKGVYLINYGESVRKIVVQ